jgi:hypothetical protein
MQRIGPLNPRKMRPATPVAPKTVCPPGTVILQVGFMIYTLGACAVPLIESRPSAVHNASVLPFHVYSSPQPPPPPSRRSTHPTAPTHEHASSFLRQPTPPPSGSVSHYQPSPARYASISSSSPPPPMTQSAATIPMPVHPTSMPYDMGPRPPSHSEMSGGPQPYSQSRSYRACAAYNSLVSFSCE